MVSPPGSPEGVLKRPASMYSTQSPEAAQKSRPQSMIYRPPRSHSRMSTSSRHGESRLSDEDGKTSVKVVVRVRPPLGPSDPGFELIPQRFQRSMVKVNTNTSLGVDSPQGRKIFIFDRVFGEDINQRGIWDYLQESVDSFLQGYNVSILAYGQSGSGKSYTMGTSGPAEQNDASSKGVISRAAKHLFDHLNGDSATSSHSRQTSGLKTPTRYSIGNMATILQNSVHNSSKSGGDKSWELSVTYVEIYNEQPRDLLIPDSTPPTERPTVLIREDTKGRIYVEGLKSVKINTMEELLSVLNHGSTIRQTDATAINARSSRSHAVFTVNLRQSKSQTSVTTPRDKRGSTSLDAMTNGDSTITVESKLHFVDLAGSERLKNTGATGDRAKEGISINAGLASLGKVISQLSTRAAGSHVSYRDSKLTRMLQDSLGGNAITYMIACVTPAEFHLSETLNTVQYAQRARNIQSKPKIQQISDDADKQAVIDRLRTEVAFLRQQIRSTEGGERRNLAHLDRLDRPNEREVDLQNQLLDVQESYTTLSQRHARLISDLSKSGEVNGERHIANHVSGESSMDRLKRSQANHAHIEQVVLEYEKTIQSLETNLSTTRSSLANTESTLLEKETKCAYVETMNQQLHSRVQKLMDRESNTETYLRELESRLEGHSSGSEKSDAVITDLRKEIGRIRESETNAEDYITTLEERLAEADQDMELMQRELERLDHLVERQRSLGKLDNLLYELDHIQQQDKEAQKPSDLEDVTKDIPGLEHDRALETLKEAKETELPEEVEDELQQSHAEAELDVTSQENDDGLKALEKATATNTKTLALAQRQESLQPSPAQSRFVAEKFEVVSQELFDLRLEHESTVTEFDLLSRKYHEALRTLAEMQDVADEARHGLSDRGQSPDEISPISRPISFLEDARIQDLRNGGHLSSSRSLSSELSLAGESHTSTDPSDITPVSKKPESSEFASHEIERLQQLLAEHERDMNLVSQQYAELQAEHQDTLKTVETLKSEAQRPRFREERPSSPTLAAPGMLRRMSSQVSGVDRGQRSITSLRTLMTEEFVDQPDKLEGAEVHLTAATHELHSRMEKIQSLEAENKSVKKEMEMKTTIIAGLTRERERSSLKNASPVDLSMVSQMRDQLIQKETQLKSIHEAYAGREQELQNEVASLKAEQTKQQVLLSADRKKVGDNDSKLKELQQQLDELSAKHATAAEAAESSKQQHATTAAELAAALATVETMKVKHTTTNKDDSLFDKAATANAMQTERDNYRDLVDDLKRKNEEHRSFNAAQSETIAQLERQRSTLQIQADQYVKTIEAQNAQIQHHLSNIDSLKKEITDAQSAVEFHKHGLKSLHETHANAIEEMKLSHAGAMADIDEQLAEHTKKQESLQSEVARSKNIVQDLVAGAQMALGHPTSANMLGSHIQDLIEEKKHVSTANARLVSTNAELERQLTGRQNLQELEEELKNANGQISNYKETIRNLANEVGNHEEALREKDKTISKHLAALEVVNADKQKKTNLIEELEQQLQSSFDQHSKRISSMQDQGNQALADAQRRIAALEKEIDARKSFIDSENAASRSNTMKSQRPHSPMTDSQQRSNSMTSNLRKSASIASLPSPPPAIPLPPLPLMPAGMMAGISNPSPPNSRHTSKELTAPQVHHGAPHSPSLSPAQQQQSTAEKARQSALIEEQESRLRTIEKHLHAEKQLTATLEEALVDLETQGNKLRADAEGWKKKAWAAEEELGGLRKERRSERLSVQAVEEERGKRVEAEKAREVLEERMRALAVNGTGMDGRKKKKAGGLNCF